MNGIANRVLFFVSAFGAALSLALCFSPPIFTSSLLGHSVRLDPSATVRLPPLPERRRDSQGEVDANPSAPAAPSTPAPSEPSTPAPSEPSTPSPFSGSGSSLAAAFAAAQAAVGPPDPAHFLKLNYAIEKVANAKSARQRAEAIAELRIAFYHTQFAVDAAFDELNRSLVRRQSPVDAAFDELNRSLVRRHSQFDGNAPAVRAANEEKATIIPELNTSNSSSDLYFKIASIFLGLLSAAGIWYSARTNARNHRLTSEKHPLELKRLQRETTVEEQRPAA